MRSPGESPMMLAEETLFVENYLERHSGIEAERHVPIQHAQNPSAYFDRLPLREAHDAAKHAADLELRSAVETDPHSALGNIGNGIVPVADLEAGAGAGGILNAVVLTVRHR